MDKSYKASFFIFTLSLLGALLFIPDIFVNRFLTGPLLWISLCMGLGCVFFLFSAKGIRMPSGRLLMLFLVWTAYFLIRDGFSITASLKISFIFLIFIFFYNFWYRYLKSEAFLVFVLLGTLLSFMSLGQFFRWIPIFNVNNSITGPFDNVVGLSASVALLFPFALYHIEKKQSFLKWLGISTSLLIVIVVLLSLSRAGILSLFIITTFYIGRIKLKKKNKKVTIPIYFVFGVFCLFLSLFLYFFKKASADGRLLIWHGSAQMIKKKPFFGLGEQGFTSNYMVEQAGYFAKNKDSIFSKVAGNVNRPFNEYLREILCYGFIGLFISGFLIFYILYMSRKSVTKEMLTVRLSLLSIAISALFSYPLEYPFICFMTIALFAYATNFIANEILIPNSLSVKLIWMVGVSGIMTLSLYSAYHEYLWSDIAKRSLKGETKEVISVYKKLFDHSFLRKNGLFLYNYAAELSVIGNYEHSNNVLLHCTQYWNDFDVQMLMGYNYESISELSLAENHYRLAHLMVPSKFIPLYNLVGIYKKSDQKKKAYELAREIIHKPVKIPSLTIGQIKREMNQLVGSHGDEGMNTVEDENIIDQ